MSETYDHHHLNVLNHFVHTEPNLNRRLHVTFVNELGLEESGIDGGGLSREFLSSVLMQAFDVKQGFFLATADNTLYPNPNAAAVTDNYKEHYYFIGRILARVCTCACVFVNSKGVDSLGLCLCNTCTSLVYVVGVVHFAVIRMGRIS